MIGLIDYGAGNLTSVRKALSMLGAEFITPQSPDQLSNVNGIIVPGVGHFGATRAIDARWRAAIAAALERGAALLGICLGMQWLFEGSDEAPALQGLGTFRGACVHLSASSQPGLKVPHVGWNSLEFATRGGLLDDITDGAQVYFTHSYVAPVVSDTAAVTTYGMPFSAVIERGRVAGVQFHPEKSGEVGLRILRNWINSCQ